MSRYTENSIALQKIDKAFRDYASHDDFLQLFSDCRCAIIDASTADVQEVRHGKWIKEHFISESDEFYHTCSNCNMELKETYLDNYCPNCGAKMDKVTLSSLFENYDEDYTPERVDWGKPVGREI